MYGLVNKALQNMLTEHHGEKNWKLIKQRANVDINVFISNLDYPDQITYNLIEAASDELNVDASILLHNFGKYWVLKTGAESYGDLFKSAGETLKDFLINLPDFHARVMLYYPNLSPPTFFIENVKEESLDLHYMSHRLGLTEFVRGLIHGLSEFYDTSVEVYSRPGMEGQLAHDIFTIEFKSRTR